MLFLANGSHEPTWTVRKGGERGGGHRRKRVREEGSHRLYENNTFNMILFPVTNGRSDCCRLQYVVQMSWLDYIGRISTAVSIQSYCLFIACCRFLAWNDRYDRYILCLPPIQQPKKPARTNDHAGVGGH